MLEAASKVAAVNSVAHNAQTQHLIAFIEGAKTNDQGRTRWDHCKALQTWSKFLGYADGSVKVVRGSDCSPECLQG